MRKGVAATMREEIGYTPADDEPEKYPVLIRVYGALSVVAGGVQILMFTLAALLLLSGHLELSNLEELATTTLVIGAVEVVANAVLAAMFVLLGIRLLRGKRHLAALIANIMIAFEAVVLICQLMLDGLGVELIPAGVNMAILIALETYSDPALREERSLQRRLRQMEVRTEAEEGTLGRDATGKGYITLNFFNVFWIFAICCVLGLSVELAYHMTIVNPGHYQDRAGLLYGPFSPIYGFGAVLMTMALNRFHDSNPLVVFLVSAVIGGAFEFFVSWFMQTAFGITAWDYTGTFLSIDGRTNGKFMFMWGMMGLVWIKVCLPIMLDIVNKIPWNWRYVVTVVCTTLMLTDAGLTLASLDCWYRREAGTMDYADASAIVQFCNSHYDDAYMAERFQTMSIDTAAASRV